DLRVTMRLGEPPSTERGMLKPSQPEVDAIEDDMRLLPHAEILLMMKPVGQISLGEVLSDLTVNIDAALNDDRPAVYAWVADGEILYIGKAGRGVAKRMRQHNNGFRHSTRGRSHAEYLARLIEHGKSIVL